ncbi:hypothetical protein Q4544_07220 [Cognatishimia sp. 1_MG-2023]|nr:hypothetical protein [Cognatishimia sp. 1_MG-2023]
MMSVTVYSVTLPQAGGPTMSPLDHLRLLLILLVNACMREALPKLG